MRAREAELETKLPPIYTIGYGSRSLADLVNTLKRYAIQYVIDVRSQPYSRYRPEFSREVLEHHLAEQRLRYVYMGDLLGGRPGKSTFYTEGKVDYSKFWNSPSFNAGVERLKKAREKNLRVVLMCSEGKPQDCHRSKMIGTFLADGGITVQHIDEKGQLRSHEDILALLTGGQKPLPEMELPSSVTMSRKRYRPVPESGPEDEQWP